VRAVVMDSAADVGICKFSCNKDVTIYIRIILVLREYIFKLPTQLAIMISHVSSSAPYGPRISEASLGSF